MNHPLQSHSAFTLTPLPLGEIASWQLQTDTGLQSGWRRRCSTHDGADWLVLHGGPGSGASPSLLDPFTDMAVNAWAPNQRRCEPLPERVSSPLSVARMVEDLEALRRACGVTQWSVMAGSWGSYLALAYLTRYPDSVRRLVLRGSFFGGRADIWRFVQNMPPSLLRPTGLFVPRSIGGLASWLIRVAHVYQYGAVGTSRKKLSHAWAQAETRLALHGARRAKRAMAQDAALRVAQHQVVRGLSASLRRTVVAGRMDKPVESRLARKVAIQTRMLPDLLAKPVLRSAKPFQGWKTPRMALVHGQFDAVCRPEHSRQLFLAVERLAGDGAQVSIHACQAGHLGHEPAIRQALMACISARGLG